MNVPEEKSRFEGDSIFDASDGTTTLPDVVGRFQLTQPAPVMVIIGGADRMDAEIGRRVKAFFERTLAPVLESSGMFVVTGGTDSGVMAIAGQTLSRVATLIGISPRGALEESGVSLQADHHLSVLTAGDTWGSETDYMVKLAVALTQGARCGLVLLVNGGAVALEEIRYFVDAGWPILSLAGSGGMADALLAARRPPALTQPVWDAIKAADLRHIDLDGSSSQARKFIHWYVSSDELLKSAWTYAVALDLRAGRQRLLNGRIRGILQVASLAALSLVLIKFEIRDPDPSPPWYLAWTSANAFVGLAKQVTAPIAVALPIALAVAAAVSQSVAADRGWRVMREAAEALKRDIYRYRACLVGEAGNASSLHDARIGLGEAVDDALRRSADSGFLLAVDLSSRRSRPPGLDEGDDELAPLTVTSYTSHRIDGQIAYFQKSGSDLRKKALYAVLLGVFLAAFSGFIADTYFAPWAAIAVLGVTGLSAYAERTRMSDRASRYAAASADLAKVKSRLQAEGLSIMSQPAALLTIVADAEQALERESVAWEQLVWRGVREARR